MISFEADNASFQAAFDVLVDITDTLNGKAGFLYHEFSDIMQASITQNFAESGRPTWPPRKYEYPHPPLIKSGELRESAINSARSSNWQHNSKEHLLEIRTIFYGYFHQYASGLNVKFDERKFVEMQPQDIQAMQEAYERVLSRL